VDEFQLQGQRRHQGLACGQATPILLWNAEGPSIAQFRSGKQNWIQCLEEEMGELALHGNGR